MHCSKILALRSHEKCSATNDLPLSDIDFHSCPRSNDTTRSANSRALSATHSVSPEMPPTPLFPALVTTVGVPQDSASRTLVCTPIFSLIGQMLTFAFLMKVEMSSTFPVTTTFVPNRAVAVSSRTSGSAPTIQRVADG